MAHDVIDAFQEGAAAAVRRHGVGQWDNPYLPLMLDAMHRCEPMGDIPRKFDAWDQGWEWQAAKLYGPAVRITP